VPAAVPAPAPPPAPALPTVPAATQVEQRGLPIVTALARIARGADPPRVRLERAARLLLTAYGEGDPDFSGLFLTGWARARHDKQFRLTLAWQREQIRLSLEEILLEGVRAGGFRRDLDAGAVATLIVGAAEGCLLQAVTEGGAVAAERLVGALLTLAISGA
jgi:transcriptional regulator BetI-like protein